MLIGCKSPVYENLEINIESNYSDLDLQLFYQDDFISSYEEDKSVKSKNNQQYYLFSIENQPVKRFRIDIDNLKHDEILLNEISIHVNNKNIVLRGKKILSFFMFNESIETNLNTDNSVTLLIKDKTDPYFVSKNLDLIDVF